MAGELKVIGTDVPRVDARAKVTGQARYTVDIQLPGMLYARVLRSPHPHARIIAIDTSTAEALPGVLGIIHHRNTQVRWHGGIWDGYSDEIVERFGLVRWLFNNPVRFAGEAVAAVAAVDRHTALEAVELIKVEYETLPHVLDAEAALRPDAPQLHGGPSNLLLDAPDVMDVGNVDVGLAEAEVVIEATFRTSYLNNAQMEPRAAVATWEGSKLKVWTTTAGLHITRDGLARDLGLPLNRVQVISMYTGGSFGGKDMEHDFHLMAAVLARQLRRAVKVEYERHEDFLAVHGRWPTTMHFKVGAKKDGTVTAFSMKGYAGVGAYAKGPVAIRGLRELYRCPNMRTEVYRAYTNMACSGNVRGPHYPQGIFGSESAIDELAHRLSIDPVEMRLRNHILLDDPKFPVTSALIAECLQEGARRIGWREKWHPPGTRENGPRLHGIGVALGQKPAGGGMSRKGSGTGSALVRINQDGSVQVYAGIVDVGQGSKTVMALIAAEVLGMPLDRVELVTGDSDTTPKVHGESGSKTTLAVGTAVRSAANEARQKLVAHCASQLSVAPDQISILDGQLLAGGQPAALTLEHALQRLPDAILVTVMTDAASGVGAFVPYCAHFIEVEVDRETGRVHILDYVAVQDCGRIISPLTARNQIKGGVIQGLGMALSERLVYDTWTGIALNPGFYGDRVLTHMEAPAVDVAFLDQPDPYGPFGAKNLGEFPTVAPPAAMANAVFNATGVRIRELPLTPDRILAALRAPSARRQGDNAVDRPGQADPAPGRSD